MLRFLSRRKVRSNYVESRGGVAGGPGGGGVTNANSSSGTQIKAQRMPVNKNKIECRVVLLDNTDLSIELSVSTNIKLFIANTVNIVYKYECIN